MTKYHKELEELAQMVNEMNLLIYEIHVNRRNGYYAIDKYDQCKTNFYGAFLIGDYKEVKNYLKGMVNAYYFITAF